ncbi:MAG: hypothetical protein GY833_12695 [Aestuariibacter sp.]|nr:hypothetical protein [Aestuariibacter sp.]|tara:strand:+ start:125566 stop:125874 length:309 start_codon:yes stop_codon:yes gene_type:complete
MSNSIADSNISHQHVPDDEWGLLPILAKFNAEAALPEIVERFDSFCNAYMSNHDEIKRSANTAMACYLGMALIDSENGKCDLRERISEILAGLNEKADGNKE